MAGSRARIETRLTSTADVRIDSLYPPGPGLSEQGGEFRGPRVAAATAMPRPAIMLVMPEKRPTTRIGRHDRHGFSYH